MNARNDTALGEVCPIDNGPLVSVCAASMRATITTLTRFAEFFHHHSSPTVHAELRAFCETLHRHGDSGADALLDFLDADAFRVGKPPRHRHHAR
jgi:hypothetical protein